MDKPTFNTPGTLMREQVNLAGQNPPGVTGTPPLDSSQVYIRQPSTLSEGEKEKLTAIGVDYSQGIPSNLAQIIRNVQDDASSFRSPVPLDHVAQEMTVTPIEKLPPERQAQIRAEMALALQTIKSGGAQQKFAADVPSPKVIQTQSNRPSVQVVDDEEEPSPAVNQTPVSESNSIVGKCPPNCPHCGWDMSLIDDIVVEDGDKSVFIQACLGDISFEKTYQLMDGAMEVTFRTLTSQEIDMIFATTHKKRLRNEVVTQMELFEFVQRFRTSLQLVRLKRGDKIENFPAGLNSASNPEAKTLWDQSDGIVVEDGQELLDQVELLVRKRVLKNESIFRMVGRECAQFNRLVTKLEAMVDQPDFWKPTAAA